MKIQNISRYGELDVPLLGREIAADAVEEVTADQARRLLVLDTTFVPADEEATAIAAELAADALSPTTYGPVSTGAEPDLEPESQPESEPAAAPTTDPARGGRSTSRRAQR